MENTIFITTYLYFVINNNRYTCQVKNAVEVKTFDVDSFTTAIVENGCDF